MNAERAEQNAEDARRDLVRRARVAGGGWRWRHGPQRGGRVQVSGKFSEGSQWFPFGGAFELHERLGIDAPFGQPPAYLFRCYRAVRLAGAANDSIHKK